MQVTSPIASRPGGLSIKLQLGSTLANSGNQGLVQTTLVVAPTSSSKTPQNFDASAISPYAGDDDAPLLTVSTPKSAKKKTPAAKAKPASLTPKSASKSAAKAPPKPDATASNAGKAKRSRKRNPEESSKTLATFSVARIRAMMKQDPKVDMLSGDSTTAMSYATECFLRHFAKAVYAKRTPGARMITYDTMSEAVASDKSFTFLQEMIPERVPFTEDMKN